MDAVVQQPKQQARPWLAKPFQPGQSGNPKGRPKGTKFDLTSRVRRYLKREHLLDESGKYEPSGKLFVRTMIREAIAGDPRWGKILVSILMPREVASLVTINNNILSHVEGNLMIDAAALTAPIESRAEPPLLEEPQPILPAPEPKE